MILLRRVFFSPQEFSLSSTMPLRRERRYLEARMVSLSRERCYYEIRKRYLFVLYNKKQKIMAQKTLTTSYLTKKQINNEINKEISKNYPVVRRSRCRIRLSALIIVDKRAGESDVMQHFRPPFCTFNAQIVSSLRKKLYLCNRIFNPNTYLLCAQ